MMSLPPDKRKQSRENDAHIPKKWYKWLLVIWWDMDVCYHLGEYSIVIEMKSYFCYTVYIFLLLFKTMYLCSSFKNVR